MYAATFGQSLDQKVEKNSPSLGREAVYSQRSRLTRLPTYLTVHMVRFAWRADIRKKAKIMASINVIKLLESQLIIQFPLPITAQSEIPA